VERELERIDALRRDQDAALTPDESTPPGVLPLALEA
jgi:hypothetical protein